MFDGAPAYGDMVVVLEVAIVTGDRNNGPDTARGAGGRFGPGNPGRPRGARHRVTVAVEAILGAGAREIGRKAVALAKTGDLGAIKLILDRVVPVRREHPIAVDLGDVQTLADHPRAAAALVASMAAGLISPAEAESAGRVLAGHRQAIEAADIEARLAALEAQLRPPAKSAAA